MPKKCLICCTVLTRKNSEYKSDICIRCKANINADCNENNKKKEK